jgi:NAD(P)-dependent dehydrogenase (short-subunit alcohol dehydrogenase family)
MLSLAGRRALITGSSQGFGLAVARAFVQAGAHVALCARSPAPLSQAEHELTQLAAGKTRVVAGPGDVSSAKDVERILTLVNHELGGLDILVCNAGVYGPKGPLEETSLDEWSRAVTINLLGTVLPCHAALPTLKAQQSGKILILSGGGATKPMPYLSAYAASKAAVVRFGETLAEEVRDFGIDVTMIAPGAMNTRMLDEVLAAGPDRVGEAYYRQALRQKEEGGAPLDRGASLCVFLASTESDGITGKLISAIWDPWEDLPNHLAEIVRSDIYTLRRIVPHDRGLSWG